MTDEKEITAKDFSELKNRSQSWGTRLAKRSVKMGNPFPVKKGNYWFATYDQWEKALAMSGIKMRSPKKKKQKK